MRGRARGAGTQRAGAPARAAPNPALERLILRAHDEGWNPERDLPWDAPVDARALDVPDGASISSRLAVFGDLDAAGRAHLKQRELAAHLSCLAYGEERAALLAAQTVLARTPPDRAETWFLATLMADEAKHSATLSRYLEEKLGVVYPAHPALGAVFDELTRTRDFHLNLFVGQVALEGAASALLSSLLMGVREPLLRTLLRRVMRDEARHMKFAHVVAADTLDGLSAARRRRMEDVLFEAAYAGAASLLPLPAWDEVGLARGPAVRGGVDELKRRGVLRFYCELMPVQLEHRGFPAQRLARRLERLLEERLRSAG